MHLKGCLLYISHHFQVGFCSSRVFCCAELTVLLEMAGLCFVSVSNVSCISRSLQPSVLRGCRIHSTWNRRALFPSKRGFCQEAQHSQSGLLWPPCCLEQEPQRTVRTHPGRDPAYLGWVRADVHPAPPGILPSSRTPPRRPSESVLADLPSPEARPAAFLPLYISSILTVTTV